MPGFRRTHRQRDVLVILCDQLRPDFLPAYGGTSFSTPSIDRLCREGVLFDRAVTCSTVCAPARAGMLTGRLVGEHGVWTNDVPFRPGLEYLPQLMRDLGYSTFACGKLHHFPPDDPKGFQLVHGMEEGRLGEREPYLLWLRRRHPEARTVWQVAGDHFALPEEEYYEHWIADRAIECLEECAPRTPFFGWISFQGPHTPFDPPREVSGRVDLSRLPRPLQRAHAPLSDVEAYRRAWGSMRWRDEAQIMKLRQAYAEMVVEIDDQIGRVLEALQRLGRLEATTVIFSSDHGDLLGDYQLGEKGPFPYQGQLGIPLVLSNDPDVERGTQSKALASNLDIAATCLAVAGRMRPFGLSRDLRDLARRDPRHPREVAFSQHCDTIKTVDDGRWRYSYWPFDGSAALFDRENDPVESTNLSGDPSCAEIEGRMLRHLLDFAVIEKGVRIEAHDLPPKSRMRLEAKDPGWLDRFPVAFPVSSRGQLDGVRRAGLDDGYNEYCKGRPRVADYGVYWE